jgi:hypothetical protein
MIKKCLNLKKFIHKFNTLQISPSIKIIINNKFFLIKKYVSIII